MKTNYTLPAIVFVLFFPIALFSQVPGAKWTRYLNRATGFGQGNTYILESKLTPDGGLVMVGVDTGFTYVKNDILNKRPEGRPWIGKFDSSGYRVWSSHAMWPFISGNCAYVSVCTTATGKYAVTGYGSEAGPVDVLFRLFNSDGTLSFQSEYGGTATDMGFSIQATSDGGYILTGLTASIDGNVIGNHSLPGLSDVWLLKLDATYNIQWQRCFGGNFSDTGYAVIQTSDNGYIIAGSATSANGNLTGNNGLSDGWVFKTDDTGNLQWQKNIGGAGHEAFKSIVDNGDGTYTLTGYTTSATAPSNGLKGGMDVWVVNIAGSTGDVIWSKGYGGTADEQGFSVGKGNGNTYLVGGYTESSNNDVTGNNGRSDAWLINLAADGTLLWQQAIGTTNDEFGMSVNHLSGNDYIISGFANPFTPEPLDSADGYVVRLGNTNTIKGYLFKDDNANGILDPGEPPFDGAMVQSVKTGDSRQSAPFNGLFSTIVDTGAYTTSVVFRYPYYNAVPASYNSNFATYFNTDSFSFAIQPVAGINDLAVEAIALNTARAGLTVTYKLYYKNRGTVAIPAPELQFKHDSRLDFLSATPAISSSVGDTLKWTIPAMQPLDSASVTVTLRVGVPPDVNLGDTLSSIAFILPVAGDTTPVDNTSYLKQRVTGSFDPNDKAENAAGKISRQQITKGEYLNYVIRFQNTGNDTAFIVSIRDTLDTRLDWNSFEMIASSHPYRLQIRSNNQLNWDFPGILLVDSNKNEPASHGFIAYRIKPQISLANGDIINNSASIYFDFNLPVKTNTTLTTVEDLTLPLTLLSFTGVYHNGQAVLRWATTNEYNVSRFELERSSNSSGFVTAGMKDATNSAAVMEYNLADDLSGVNASIIYYRLKMVDMDGKTTYSRVVAIRKGKEDTGELMIAPNPVSGDQLQLFVAAPAEATVEIRIVEVSGRMIRQQKHRVYTGVNTITMTGLGGLQTGPYVLQVIGDKGVKAVKFIRAN